MLFSSSTNRDTFGLKYSTGTGPECCCCCCCCSGAVKCRFKVIIQLKWNSVDDALCSWSKCTSSLGRTQNPTPDKSVQIFPFLRLHDMTFVSLAEEEKWGRQYCKITGCHDERSFTSTYGTPHSIGDTQANRERAETTANPSTTAEV